MIKKVNGRFDNSSTSPTIKKFNYTADMNS